MQALSQKRIQTLSAMDVLAPTSMKNAAKCDTSCELQNQRVIKTLNATCTSFGEYVCWSVYSSPPQVACRLVQAIAFFAHNTAEDVHSRCNTCSRPILPPGQLVCLGGVERRYDVNKHHYLCPCLSVFTAWRIWCAAIRLDLQSVKNTR